MPKVSVVIPVYNAVDYVKLTIESILSQTYQDFEIVCVDDASTDGSLKVIREIDDKRIKVYVNEKNKGIAYTRNRAMMLAEGEYIAFMDHDDIAPTYRLEKEVEFLNNNRNIDMVGGGSQNIDENGNELATIFYPLTNYKYIKACLMLGNCFASGSVMIRKEFVKKNELRFKDNQYGAEDYRFWMEASLCGNVANIGETLLYWRTGHQNETSRVLEGNAKERKQAIAQIHTDALIKNGFILSDEEIKIINHVFEEEGILENEDDIRNLYKTLKNISRQADIIHAENTYEVKVMCRKKFGEKVGKAFFLWE